MRSYSFSGPWRCVRNISEYWSTVRIEVLNSDFYPHPLDSIFNIQRSTFISLPPPPRKCAATVDDRTNRSHQFFFMSILFYGTATVIVIRVSCQRQREIITWTTNLRNSSHKFAESGAMSRCAYCLANLLIWKCHVPVVAFGCGREWCKIPTMRKYHTCIFDTLTRFLNRTERDGVSPRILSGFLLIEKMISLNAKPHETWEGLVLKSVT